MSNRPDDSIDSGSSSVGYRRPPKNSRFKKGISGNPKGWPKGSLNLAATFARALRERVVINEHGQRKTVTKLEAALKQLVNKAASGELRALSQLVQLARDAETKQNLADAGEPILGEVHQQIMEGILKRFNTTPEPESKGLDIAEGAIDDDH